MAKVADGLRATHLQISWVGRAHFAVAGPDPAFDAQTCLQHHRLAKNDGDLLPQTGHSAAVAEAVLNGGVPGKRVSAAVLRVCRVIVNCLAYGAGQTKGNVGDGRGADI